MERPFYIVDVFTSTPFSGNPAAVVFDALGLSDDAMRSIAAEFNLSETAFVLPPSGEGANNGTPPDIRIRWFTPVAEVDMCGHATIAGVHAMVESNRLGIDEETGGATIRIETRSGTLTAFAERVPGSDGQRMLWLDLVDPTLAPFAIVDPEFANLLNLSIDAFDTSFPPMRTQDQDALVFVRDFQALNDARPRLAELSAWMDSRGLRGLCLATVKTLTPTLAVQSRFFAPSFGVDEDPVTGSVHGPLAAYLVQKGVVEVQDGIAGMQCGQAKSGGRAGTVFALVQPKDDNVYSVRIGGQAVTVMRGRLIC